MRARQSNRRVGRAAGSEPGLEANRQAGKLPPGCAVGSKHVAFPFAAFSPTGSLETRSQADPLPEDSDPLIGDGDIVTSGTKA